MSQFGACLYETNAIGLGVCGACMTLILAVFFTARKRNMHFKNITNGYRNEKIIRFQTIAHRYNK